MAAKDVLFFHDFYKKQNQGFTDTEQQYEQISDYYMIVVEGGNVNFSSNEFSNLYLFQGLIYMTGGIVSTYSNKFSDSTFIYSPVIYYLKQQIYSLTDLNVQKFVQDTNRLKDENLQFLNSNTDFSSFHLIENPVGTFEVSKVTFDSVNCLQCKTGLFGLVKATKSITFKTLKFTNCKSSKGQLYLAGNTPANSKTGRILQSSLLMTLNDMIFQGNQADYGGAIYANYISVTIQTAFIKSNKSLQQGGGIYFYNTESDNPSVTLTLNGCTIQQNNAQVGGGIKTSGSFLVQDQNTIINQNTASAFGADLTTYPIALKIVVPNDKTIQYDQEKQATIINNWVSGVSTDQEIIFYLLGTDNAVQKLDSEQTATLKLDLNYGPNTQAPTDAKITGASTVNYDATIGGFKLNQVIFQKSPEQSLQIKATSSIIQKQVTNQGQVSFDKSYIFPIIFNMRKCVIGEAFISSTGICFKCEKGTYSLVEGATFCQDCPATGVDSCPGGNQLNLTSQNWRSDESSDFIVNCYNQPYNCGGGLDIGDKSCKEGHIGALCEVCDISARYWPESYSNSAEFACGKCSEVTGNSLKMVGLSIYTIIAIYFSVKSTKVLLDSYIITFYLIKVGFIQQKAGQSGESVGIIIKLFTTYVQLFLVITTFKLKLPPGLNEISVNVGDPAQQMTFSMDCALYSMSGGIPMTYFRLMWSMLMPILYVLTFLSFHMIYYKIKGYQNRPVIIWISFIYIYISMQPSIVRSNIQTVSCRDIGGHQYIKSNVSELCYTSQHIEYILLLILPTLIVWVVVIPMYFLRQMYKGRMKLQTLSMQYKFGFLYTEYKQDSYFWEIVKIYQKTFVTIFINVYDSYKDIKGVLVVLIKYNPYRERRFNDIDLTSNYTVITSIIIAMFILDNPYAYLIWFGYIILFVINILFVIRLIRILVSSYTQKFENKLRAVFCRVSSKYPKIFKMLNLPTVPKERLNALWKTFRKHVQEKYPKKENAKEVRVEDIENINKLAEKIKNKQSQHSLDQNQKLVKLSEDDENSEPFNNYDKVFQLDCNSPFNEPVKTTNVVNIRPKSSRFKPYEDSPIQMPIIGQDPQNQPYLIQYQTPNNISVATAVVEDLDLNSQYAGANTNQVLKVTNQAPLSIFNQLQQEKNNNQEDDFNMQLQQDDSQIEETKEN